MGPARFHCATLLAWLRLDPIGSLNNVWDWILDPLGSPMELMVSDLWSQEIMDPSYVSGFNYAIFTGCFTNNVTISKRNISRNNACISTKISLYNRKIIPNNILNS